MWDSWLAKHVLPPWFASMVMAALRQTHRGQEYRGRASQGAALDKQACRVGCHCARMYTMKTGCSFFSELQRSSTASTYQASSLNIIFKVDHINMNTQQPHTPGNMPYDMYLYIYTYIYIYIYMYIYMGLLVNKAHVTSMVRLNGHGRITADTLWSGI